MHARRIWGLEMKRVFDFSTDRRDVFAFGRNRYFCCPIVRKTLAVEALELVAILTQGSIARILLATTPKLVDGRIEKYGRKFLKQFAIFLLGEGSATQGDNAERYLFVRQKIVG